MSANDYRLYAAHEAEVMKIEGHQFVMTLECESHFIPDKQSDFYKHGKREQSFGIAQINLPSHSDITYAESTDGIFSINWAAKQFSLGNAHIWTCYRTLFGNSDP